MKKLQVLLVVMAWVPALEAQVVLPESGFLAGPLEPTQSQLGDEFFNFPEFMGMRPLPGESPLSGWMQFVFDEPFTDVDGQTKAVFHFTFDATGPTDMWAFENGQAYRLADNQAVNHPAFPNQGILNLDTGAIEVFVLNAIFRNSTIAEVDRNNRIPFAFPPSYPPPPLPPEILAPLSIPPGSIFTDAAFTYDHFGRITGFQFFGLTVVPVGILGPLNPMVQLFPLFSFGPNGEFYFANPHECLFDFTICPTYDDNPEGILLPVPSFFRPYFILGTHQLEEVAAVRSAPSCASTSRSDAVVVAAGNKLYIIGGVGGDGRVTNSVDVYDPTTDSWSAGPPLPVRVAQAQGAVLGSKIYVYGGRQWLRRGALTLLQVFDTVTGEWSLGPEGPVPVALGVAEFAGDKLYVLTGKTNRPNGSTAGNLRSNFTALRFDPVNGLWKEFAAVIGETGERIVIERASAVTVGSNVYVMGGRKRDGEPSDRVWVLVGVNDQFKEGPEICFEPYDGHEQCRAVYDAATAAVANRIYLIGGREEADGPATASVQVLATGTDRWSQLRQAPFPVAAAGGATLRGEIYVAGGRSQATSDSYPGIPTDVLQGYHPGRGWSVCDSRPLLTADDVLNSASLSLEPRELSPGSLAVATGHNFGGPAEAPADAPVPTELAGISITVDGQPAAILSVHPNRVDFQLPFGVTPGAAELQILKQDSAQQAPAIKVPVANVAPGIFVENFGETRNQIYLDTGSVIACNADGTLNYPANAVPPGGEVTIRTTGLGSVTPAVADGERAPAGVSVDRQVRVTIDGIDAPVTSAELAEGEVGLYDVTVTVPDGARELSRVFVELTVGGVTSNRGSLAIGTPTNPFPPLPCVVPIPPTEP